MDNNMDQPGAAGEFAGEFGTQTDEADHDAKEQIARLRAQKLTAIRNWAGRKAAFYPTK